MLLDAFTGGIHVTRNGKWRRFSLAHFSYTAVMGLSLKYRPVIEAKSNNCCLTVVPWLMV